MSDNGLPVFTVGDTMDVASREEILYLYRNNPVELMTITTEMGFQINEDLLSGISTIPQKSLMEIVYHLTEMSWVALVIEYNQNPSVFLKTMILITQEHTKNEPSTPLIKWFSTQMSLSGFEGAIKQLNSRLQNFHPPTGKEAS